jgi:ketosteroid isomerase-like protein
MSDRRAIGRLYIDYLGKGAMHKVIDLFAEEGVVHSPLYGTKKAKDFYSDLQEDTLSSFLEIKDVYESALSNNIALYFTYHWTLKSGKKIKFDVVDILTFDKRHKITSLRIIYDTVGTRPLLQHLK